MATYNRLRRCILTASLSLSRPRRFHILSIPNFSNSHTSLLRRQSPTNPTFPVTGALFSLGSRSFFTASVDIEHSIPPIRAVVSMLDEYHNFTGLPWWIVISSSIFSLRVALLPLLIYQLRKMKRIAELFKKLPPPIPRRSRRNFRSFVAQFLLFNTKRKEIGCPSLLWFLPFACVQVPCFFLFMTTVRRMSLNNHPGFDCGGAFWFPDLTEFPYGLLGSVFPVAIAGLHYANIQISFRTPSSNKPASRLESLLKYYKFYLDVLTVPIFLTCYVVPQGSLVYWATNSSLTSIQQLLFKSSPVRAMLGLLDSNPAFIAESSNADVPDRTYSGDPKIDTLHVEDLSLKGLIAISNQLLSEQQIEPAIYMLRVALSRDPGYTTALTLMGQILLMKRQSAEAMQYFERVISKLTVPDYPLNAEETNNLILASTWMGRTHCQKGKVEEGIVHFERIGNMKEPVNPAAKSRYFNGLLQLSSALRVAGRRDESLKFLQLAAAYNPAFKKFLPENENGNDPAFELLCSRQGDY